MNNLSSFNPSPQEIHKWLVGQKFSKEQWLASFSEGRNKRPDHEIEAKKYDLRIINFWREAYQKKHGGQHAA